MLLTQTSGTAFSKNFSFGPAPRGEGPQRIGPPSLRVAYCSPGGRLALTPALSRWERGQSGFYLFRFNSEILIFHSAGPVW